MGFFLDALRKLRQLDNPIVRDFTPEAEADMVQIANDVLEEDADLVSKYLTDPFGRWLDSMGYLEILYGVDNYQKNVIDCYNYTAQNIHDICEQMRTHDGQLGQSMANYHNQSSNVCILLKNLVECLDVGSSEYDARQPISDRLLWFRTKWIEDMNGEHCQGGITAVKELAQKSPEVIDYLFTDYSQGLEILDNISETSDRSGCAEMRSAIDLLRDDYNSKWKGMLHKTQEFSEDMIKKLGSKEIEDWIEEECGDTSVLKSVLDATGLESKADGYHKLLALRKVESELQDAYEAAIAKVNSGEYTEQDISAAKNMFEMLKETTKTIYETYRGMYEDDPSKLSLLKYIRKLSK